MRVELPVTTINDALAPVKISFDTTVSRARVERERTVTVCVHGPVTIYIRIFEWRESER